MTWGAPALLMCDVFYHRICCTISPCCDYTLNNNNNNEIYMGITFVFCNKSAGHNAGICMGNARGTQLGVYIPYMRKWLKLFILYTLYLQPLNQSIKQDL